MSPKNFPNPFEDYEEMKSNIYIDSNLKDVSNGFKKRLIAYKEAQLKKLHLEFGDNMFSSNCMYTGSAGIGLMYYLFAKNGPEPNDAGFTEALQYVRWEEGRGRRVTFLCGDAGPLALAAVLAHRLGSRRPSNLPDAAALCQKLERMLPVALDRSTADELLYGRVGYLYALLFVNIETGQKIISDYIITQVISAIFDSGQQLSRERGRQGEVPLLYEWHDSLYLGAAHGTAGILYILLKAKEYLSGEQLETLVEPTLQWLLGQRYLGGNLPSSLGSRGDRLVQWCHGVPGLVQLCCMAHQVFGKEEYLKAAEECGEVVWHRGLSTKGYSLCHGVAGNAYTFIELYQATKEEKHLYRACCFAEWCVEERPGTQLHRPDAPASLCEGLAGRLVFIEDMLHIRSAKFPAYAL